MGAYPFEFLRRGGASALKSPVVAVAMGVVAALAVVAVLGLTPHGASKQSTCTVSSASCLPTPTLVTTEAIATEPPEMVFPAMPPVVRGDRKVLNRGEEMVAGTFEQLGKDVLIHTPATAAVEDVAMTEEGGDPAPLEAPLALRGPVDPERPQAETKTVEIATAPPADDTSAARGQAQETVVSADDAPPTTAEPQAASGDERVVKGGGVTVRSGPSKSNKRLFALSGGQKVQVTENKKGWLHITDAKGRDGWAYKDYLR